jgi:hypothetical protein
MLMLVNSRILRGNPVVRQRFLWDERPMIDPKIPPKQFEGRGQ